MIRKYDINPVPKPRMTKSDAWKKRECVLRYWEFKDKVKDLGINISESGNHIHFILPMPKSWSNKKKIAMYGKPHQQTPDKDNLEKSLLDSIFGQDKHIYDSRVSKWWGYTGKIIIENIDPPKNPCFCNKISLKNNLIL